MLLLWRRLGFGEGRMMSNVPSLRVRKGGEID